MTVEGQAAPVAGLPRFHAVLRPYRSLGPVGFTVLMGVLAGASFAAGVFFMSIGAWPVFGFFGLDVALVYIAFRLNYRAGRLYETVDLAEGRLDVARVHPGGRREAWSFEPYWVRVELGRGRGNAPELAIASHGRRLVLARFLSPAERESFAHALMDALRPYRPA